MHLAQNGNILLRLRMAFSLHTPQKHKLFNFGQGAVFVWLQHPLRCQGFCEFDVLGENDDSEFQRAIGSRLPVFIDKVAKDVSLWARLRMSDAIAHYSIKSFKSSKSNFLDYQCDLRYLDFSRFNVWNMKVLCKNVNPVYCTIQLCCYSCANLL